MVADDLGPGGLGGQPYEGNLPGGAVPAPGGPAWQEAGASRGGPHDLVIAYHLLKNGTDDEELGGDFFERLNPERLTHNLVRRLEKLGHKVTLEPKESAAYEVLFRAELNGETSLMSFSSGSLLQRLQQSGDQAAWERLVDLYSGHLFLWACRAGLPGEQAAELVRGVFAVAAVKFAEFRPGTPGGFRAWLRGLAHAQRRELLRKQVPASVPAPADVPAPPAAADAMWEAEYLPSLLGPAVELLQAEVPTAEWKACWGVAVEGRPAADVGRELGLTPADVHTAEARVLSRLRQELDGLLD